MSEPSESTALVNYEEQLRQELAQLSGQVEAPSSNKISTKGKLFTLSDGKSSPGPINAIILDWISANAFYEGVYNPNLKKPPICFAQGKELKLLAPGANAPKKQGVECATCPKNQWKSGANNSGKACKNQRKLLIIGGPTADNTLIDYAQTLFVSPTGTKFWDAYVTELKKEYGKLPMQVVTEISFDPNQTYPMLKFRFVEHHGHLEQVMKLRAKYQDILNAEPELRPEVKAVA